MATLAAAWMVLKGLAAEPSFKSLPVEATWYYFTEILKETRIVRIVNLIFKNFIFSKLIYMRLVLIICPEQQSLPIRSYRKTEIEVSLMS